MLMLVIFIALVAMICINVPIAVALAMAGVLGLLISEGPSSLVTIALDMYSGSTKFSLIAIPMFVLAGAIMNAGGVTDRLINFVSALIGFIRGGLAMVNIQGTFGRSYLVLGFACDHHSPVNPNDPLCRLGQHIGRAAFRGRCRARASGGRWPYAGRLYLCTPI